MKKLFLIAMILIATNCYADKVRLKCWSGKHIIMNKIFEDNNVTIYDDGYIYARSKNITHIILADCIISDLS